MINSFKNKKEISLHKKIIEDNLEYIKSISSQETLKLISEEEAKIRIEACHNTLRWYQHRLLRIERFYG